MTRSSLSQETSTGTTSMELGSPSYKLTLRWSLHWEFAAFARISLGNFPRNQLIFEKNGLPLWRLNLKIDTFFGANPGVVLFRASAAACEGSRGRAPSGLPTLLGARGELLNGNMDQNLRSPGGLILTHTHTRRNFRKRK